MGRFLNFLKGQSEKDNPKVTHTSVKVVHDQAGPVSRHIFKVTHPNLGIKHLHVKVDVPHHDPFNTGDNKNGHIDIQVKRKLSNRPYDRGNIRLSHAHQRHILGRIKHHIPELQSISGYRITGARSGFNKVTTDNGHPDPGHAISAHPGKRTTVNVSKVKPISEAILRQFHLIESIA